MSFFLPLPAKGGGGEFRVILEEGGIFLQGETDTHDLPAPPAGKRYEYIEFDFLCTFGSLTAEVGDITSENRSSGKFIQDSTGNTSAWYRSLYIGAGGNRWYAGPAAEIAGNVTTASVGVVHVRADTYLWTVEYNPAMNRLSFDRAGAAPTTQINPIAYSALATAFVV